MEFVLVLFRLAKMVTMKTNRSYYYLRYKGEMNYVHLAGTTMEIAYLRFEFKKVSLMGLHGTLLVMTHGET